jgi:CheY-like chemotaxis protein
MLVIVHHNMKQTRNYSSVMAKILVIDDSKMMRRYLRHCLEKAGYEVDDWLPLSAMEVPERIATFRPDLILCDYLMTQCNGATVARMAHKANPKIPMIILTAFRDENIESSLLRLGVRKILIKPIEADALVQTIKEELASSAQDA